MSITVELSPATEHEIREKAQREHKPIEQVAGRLLDHAVAAEASPFLTVDRKVDPLEYTPNEWLAYFDNINEHFRQLKMPTLPPDADIPESFYEDEAL